LEGDWKGSGNGEPGVSTSERLNQYVRIDSGDDPKTIVFETESIENIPAGWKARETYRLLDGGDWQETFELAEPGKPFDVYTQTRLTKAK
jgi:hypothetical protein